MREGAAPAYQRSGDRVDEGWLSVMQPSNTALIHLLLHDLHRGEAESIALALEVKPDIFLLDETEARQVAGSYGLPVTGTLGVLIRASRDGQVSSLEEEMNKLRNSGHFWIHDSLYGRILDDEMKWHPEKPG